MPERDMTKWNHNFDCGSLRKGVTDDKMLVKRERTGAINVAIVSGLYSRIKV